MTPNSAEYPIVMGPDAMTTSTHASLNTAPTFATNLTNKCKYRDSVTKWTAMLRLRATTDYRAEALLRSVGLMLYLAADDDAQETIKQAETEGRIVLEGSDDDADRSALVASIISLIATDSPTEKIQREVDLLSSIQTCKRKPTEAADIFANRFKASIARYVNQSTNSHQGEDQQWAVMLLRNAMLTPDTLNAITFQLTTGAALSTTKARTVTLDAALVQSFTSSILELSADDAPEAVLSLTDAQKQQCISMLASAERSLANTTQSITLSDALAALRQVCIGTNPDPRPPIATMMAVAHDNPRMEPEYKKRRMDDVKKTSQCFACGKVGHWFLDRRECQQAMQAKRQNQPPRGNKNTGEGLRGHFFRKGGQ